MSKGAAAAGIWHTALRLRVAVDVLRYVVCTCVRLVGGGAAFFLQKEKLLLAEERSEHSGGEGGKRAQQACAQLLHFFSAHVHERA